YSLIACLLSCSIVPRFASLRWTRVLPVRRIMKCDVACFVVAWIFEARQAKRRRQVVVLPCLECAIRVGAVSTDFERVVFELLPHCRRLFVALRQNDARRILLTERLQPRHEIDFAHSAVVSVVLLPARERDRVDTPRASVVALADRIGDELDDG